MQGGVTAGCRPGLKVKPTYDAAIAGGPNVGLSRPMIHPNCNKNPCRWGRLGRAVGSRCRERAAARRHGVGVNRQRDMGDLWRRQPSERYVYTFDGGFWRAYFHVQDLLFLADHGPNLVDSFAGLRVAVDEAVFAEFPAKEGRKRAGAG